MEWTQEMDLSLAEHVLKGTREGWKATQMWQDVATLLGCEPYECQNRWEKELYNQYRLAYQLAEKCQLMKTLQQPPSTEKEDTMKQKPPIKTKTVKAVKKKRKSTKKQSKSSDIDVDNIILYLRKMKKQQEKLAEVELLKKENATLKAKIEQLTADYKELERDFSEVMVIVKRAQDISEAG